MQVRRVLAAVMIALVMAVAMITPASALPPGQYDSTFGTWWRYWDLPVQQGMTSRSWTWGNLIAAAPSTEPYVEGVRDYSKNEVTYVREPGERWVRYFDKARMEYWPDRPGYQPNQDPWKVTTGLLATELMTGRLQLGDTKFEQHQPSQVPVAGDPDSGDLTPSYADMGKVMGYQAIPAGWTVTQTIDADGTVGDNLRFASYGVSATDVGAPTKHTVASVFWAWMNQTGVTYHGDLTLTSKSTWVTGRVFPNPFYVTGYPLTEAYWTKTRVAGSEKDVLVQCFQRRCMTYTPSNPSQWKVEMANVGQHYYHWRYVEIPADKSSASTAN